MAKNQLPTHIRQLVDKNNFVIAIKTLAQEQNISLEAAKNLIDNYEASKKNTTATTQPKADQENSFDTLNQGLTNHLQQENIKLPLIPYWVKRAGVILLVMGLLGLLIWKLFN